MDRPDTHQTAYSEEASHAHFKVEIEVHIRRSLESRDIFEDLLKIRRVDLAMPPLSLAIGQEQGRRTLGTTAGTVHVDLLVRCARAAGVGICVQVGC